MQIFKIGNPLMQCMPFIGNRAVAAKNEQKCMGMKRGRSWRRHEWMASGVPLQLLLVSGYERQQRNGCASLLCQSTLISINSTPIIIMNYYYIYNFNVLPACRRRNGSWWSTCLPEGIDVALWGMTCPISARQYREPRHRWMVSIRIFIERTYCSCSLRRNFWNQRNSGQLQL